MKKIYGLIFLLTISFLAYLVVFLLPRTYELTYQNMEYQITESYHRHLKYYQFFVKYEGRTFPLIIIEPYSTKRKLIQKIEAISAENEFCLSVMVFDKIHPVCYQDEQLIDFRLANETILNYFQNQNKIYSNEIIDQYEGLKIYNYLDSDYYIWNYKGYYHLSKANKQIINLIKEDNYDNALAYQINNYLITPNYDSKYFFSEFLIINTHNKELFPFSLESEIAYHSYYLGDDGKEVYLVDKKNKLEYAFNIKKGIARIVGSENKKGIWYNNEWQEISLNKLINEDYQFNKMQVYNYQIIDNKLYYVIDKYRVLISNRQIKEIILQKDDSIYYLVDNILYTYTKATGEVKLMENNEWNFNYKNKIFIFN